MLLRTSFWVVIALILSAMPFAKASAEPQASKHGDPWPLYRLMLTRKHLASSAIIDLGSSNPSSANWQRWIQENPTYRQLRVDPLPPPLRHRPAKRCTGDVEVVARDFVAVPGVDLGTTSVTTAFSRPSHSRYETFEQREYDLVWRPLGKIKNVANCAVTTVLVDFSIRQGPKLADTQTGQLTIRLGPGQVATFTGTEVVSINNFDPKMIIHSIHWQFEDGTTGHQVR